MAGFKDNINKSFENFPFSIWVDADVLNNNVYYQKFVCDRDIRVSSVTIWVFDVGVDPANFACALYDEAGTTRIANTSTPQLAINNDNTIQFDSPVNLSKGQVYWFGVGGDASTSTVAAQNGITNASYGLFDNGATAAPEAVVAGSQNSSRPWFMLNE